MKKNIFIVGDLVIDHAIFVRENRGPNQAVKGEEAYVVLRRQDAAGGAANSARILAVLNEGTTYLWGVLGKSHWGSFRTILSSSHLLDGASSAVQLRGVEDETDAPMNTITRVILEKETGEMERVRRFDDVDHVHVPEEKRRQALTYTLRRVHEIERHPLDAIVINDLDKRCLTRTLVQDIADFANDPKHKIPLFVDPKRERDKYEGVRGTAIIPNLEEWCYLVADEDNAQSWRDNIDNHETLERMAHRSFCYLGNFRYHIIKCDRLGAVVVAPHPVRRHVYAVYRVKPIPIDHCVVSDQLGCGDLMAAVLAGEYEKGTDPTRNLLTAFHKANVVVSCYREMSWHRMPSRREVEIKGNKNPVCIPEPTVEPAAGLLFLPREPVIRLSDAETQLPGYFTVDKECKDQIARLVEEIASTDSHACKSMILAAPSGHGKGEIIASIRDRLAHKLGITVLVDNVFKEWRSGVVEEYLGRIDVGESAGRTLVIIDEAYENDDAFRSKAGLRLLQDAEKRGLRFLFVDSHFCRDHPSGALTGMMSDIRSRCVIVELPPLSERPFDIAFVIGGRLFSLAQKDGFEILHIEGMMLLAATNEILKAGNPRTPLANLERAYRTAKEKIKPPALSIGGECAAHLMQSVTRVVAGLVPRTYQVVA